MSVMSAKSAASYAPAQGALSARLALVKDEKCEAS
jgi:hypothetical protein